MYNVIDVSKETRAVVYKPQLKAPKVGVILHTTDGRNSQQWLQGESADSGRAASADILVRRDGTVLQLMPKGQYAFHAGTVTVTRIGNAPLLNSLSTYGIEAENYDRGGQLPTEAQHLAIAGVLLLLAAIHSWTPIHVVGHGAIAVPMGRRNDPRGWDWGFMFWAMSHAHERCQLYGATSAIGVIRHAY